MAEESETLFERMRLSARRASDSQLDEARMLAEMLHSGVWRERYATFEEYAIQDLQLLPGRVRELLRMERKLDEVGLDAATASEIGWEKLKTVSPKLHVENRDAMLEVLASENILTVRDKYCPRVPGVRRRVSACAGTEPTSCQRETPSNCCATEAKTVPPTAPVSGGSRNEAAVEQGAGDRSLVNTEFVAVALRIARRHMGECSDEIALNSICAIFISLMGSESEKAWIKQRLQAEQTKLRNPVPHTESVSSPPRTPQHAEGMQH